MAFKASGMFSVGTEIKKQVKISLGDDHAKNGKAHIEYVDYGTFNLFPRSHTSYSGRAFTTNSLSFHSFAQSAGTAINYQEVNHNSFSIQSAKSGAPNGKFEKKT